MPTDLAPGVPELLASEERLRTLLTVSRATAAATGRLQVAWTALPAKKGSACGDDARLALGWRIERFGAAWREAAQATRAEAERVRRTRNAPTVSPLVDERWTARLVALEAEAARQGKAEVEAGAWQRTYVRPFLAACPVPELRPMDGVAMAQVSAKGEDPLPVAVLGMGDGYVCLGAEPAEARRADDGVVMVPGGRACWARNASCGCTPEPVEPGAVLGPEEEKAGPDEEKTGAEDGKAAGAASGEDGGSKTTKGTKGTKAKDPPKTATGAKAGAPP
jgi:hypothetical protein